MNNSPSLSVRVRWLEIVTQWVQEMHTMPIRERTGLEQERALVVCLQHSCWLLTTLRFTGAMVSDNTPKSSQRVLWMKCRETQEACQVWKAESSQDS